LIGVAVRNLDAGSEAALDAVPRGGLPLAEHATAAATRRAAATRERARIDRRMI
jgi:hypothetical protein